MTISLLELKNQINGLKKGNIDEDKINSIIEQYLSEHQDTLPKEQVTKIVSELIKPEKLNVSEEKINPIIQKYLSEHQDVLPKEQVTKIINCELKTYAELKQMKDEKKLEVGKMYLLTDYATKYEQPTSKDIKTAEVESLLLTAINENSFEPIAYSPKYPNDIIYYNFDNDKCEDKKTSRNGFITKRIDTVNHNSAPGDFRGLLWVRYLPDEKQYYLKDKLVDYEVWSEGKAKLNVLYKSGNKILIAVKEAIPKNAEDGDVFKIIFDDITSELCALFIKDKTKIYKDIKIKIGKKVERKTFGKVCINNNLGDYMGLYNIVFGNGCNNNSFGKCCTENTFGSSCYSDTFGNDCHDNIFGNYCFKNTFWNGCSGNTFGNDCYNNTFWNSCGSNTFGNNCISNTFRNDYANNIFGLSCCYNTFGNNCDCNTFGNNCNSNTLGFDCDYIVFGNNCNSNTFGNNCNSNHFGSNCNNNSFGNDCDNNKFGENTKSLFIKSLKDKDLSEIDDFINKDYTITIEKCEDNNYIAKYHAHKDDKTEIINIP